MTEKNPKPIVGSWFEVQHFCDTEGKYWNPAYAGFTDEQWDLKIREQAEIGMKYLVLQVVARASATFYKSPSFPKYELEAYDPLETVLAAADKYGLKFFISNGYFYEREDMDFLNDPEIMAKRLRAMDELVRLYGHHASFHGWYWPVEAFVDGYFGEDYLKYVKTCNARARQLTPDADILIAPFGTRVVRTDDKYAAQLEELDVDIFAYQDEIGVRKTRLEESAGFYEKLRKVHDKVPRAALWADVEIFRFEGKSYKSPLIPGPFPEILQQLEAVSPYVDNILVYQYSGIMNKPGSGAFAGHPDSSVLYNDYVNWLKNSYPEMIRDF
jgi:Domain of unknown function (DUF4434)